MGHNPSPATGNPATTSPMTTGIARFLTWLAAKGNPEIEQAVIRLMFASGIVVFFAFQTFRVAHEVGLLTEAEQQLAIGLIGFWLIYIGIVASFFVWPAKNVARRVIGMLADVGFATFYVWLGGENGAFMIVVYLYVTFGNGFRYGRRYMFACQALSIIGFGAAGFFVPYWQEHHTTWTAMLTALVVLPLYISALLKHIEQARARAKEALKLHPPRGFPSGQAPTA
jgi:two-component system sensor histidine kinase RpfC